MAKKRSVKRTKISMATKRELEISENETEFSKKIKLEHKLISVQLVINTQ